MHRVVREILHQIFILSFKNKLGKQGQINRKYVFFQTSTTEKIIVIAKCNDNTVNCNCNKMSQQKSSKIIAILTKSSVKPLQAKYKCYFVYSKFS